MLSRALLDENGGKEIDGGVEEDKSFKVDEITRFSRDREEGFYDGWSVGFFGRKDADFRGGKKVGGARVWSEDVGRPVAQRNSDINVREKDGTSKSIEALIGVHGRGSGIPQYPSFNSGAGGGKFFDFRKASFNRCTTLFVINISPSTSAANLREWFGHFGSIVDVFIPKKRSKMGVCFAFVRFNLEAEACLACDKADGSVFKGFILEINIARYPRVSSQSSAAPNLGKEVENGSVALLSGDSFRKGGNSFFRPGSKSAGIFENSKEAQGVSFAQKSVGSFENSKLAQGVTFAQVIKSSTSKGFKQGNCGVKEGGLGSCGSRTDFTENGDHLRAVVFNRCWFVEAPIRRFCDSDLLADSFVSSTEFARGNSSQRIDSLGLAEAEQGSCVCGSSGEKLGKVFEADSVSLPGSLDMTDLGISNASVVSDYFRVEETAMSEEAKATAFLACEMIGAQSGSERDGVSFSSPDKGGEQITEENKDQGVVVVEEPPLSAEEKAEITDQVRYIIHDALRIGKAMGINITPRDARMIKRFAVFRHFDRKKWKMGFDDKEDELL